MAARLLPMAAILGPCNDLDENADPRASSTAGGEERYPRSGASAPKLATRVSIHQPAPGWGVTKLGGGCAIRRMINLAAEASSCSEQRHEDFGPPAWLQGCGGFRASDGLCNRRLRFYNEPPIHPHRGLADDCSIPMIRPDENPSARMPTNIVRGDLLVPRFFVMAGAL